MTIYTVLSEFKFEAAEAIAKSDALQSKLEKVAGAAEAVNTGLQQAAYSLLGQLGLYGGIGGAIYSAIKAADKFQQTQRSIANIFLSNNMFTGVNSFEASMQASAEAMENMKKTAREFSLPVSDFVSTAKMVGAGLVNHGLDDKSMKNSIQLTRGYLKSAPMLGVDPSLAQGELMDMVNGRAHMGSRLSQRLVAETSAMKPYATSGGATQAGGALGKFNALKPEERLKTLTAALMQFGSNAKVVEENAKSLSSQMQRMTDNFTGMFSVLKPIGDAILEPLKKMMLSVNIWLETHGETVAKNIGAMLSNALEDPKALYAQVQQYRKIRSDMEKAGELVMFSSIIHGITWALRALGVQLQGGLVLTGLRYLGTALSWIGGMLFTVQNFFRALTLIKYVFIEMIAPLVVFHAMFQGISRGIALAMADYVTWFAENATRLAAVIGTYKEAFVKIFAPIEFIVEGFASIARVLFSHTVGLSLFVSALEQLGPLFQWIGDVVVHLLAEISGVVGALMGMIQNLMNLNFKNFGKNMNDDASAGYHMVWDRYHKGGTQGVDTSQTSTNVINIDKINIQNMFKEQMEPDRIAFSLKDQLLKAASNPLQASGNSMAARASR